MALNSSSLAALLTNHAAMLGLIVTAFAMPFLVAGGFHGHDERTIALAASLAQAVQVFWLVSCYLLLSPRIKWTEILHAAALILLCAALWVLLFFLTGPTVATDEAIPKYLGPILVGTVSLYFITVALVADRIAKTSLGTVGYAFLIFYWPFALVAFAPRMREAFKHAAEQRSDNAQL
jgi:hypothetical protein